MEVSLLVVVPGLDGRLILKVPCGGTSYDRVVPVLFVRACTPAHSGLYIYANVQTKAGKKKTSGKCKWMKNNSRFQMDFGD